MGSVSTNPISAAGLALPPWMGPFSRRILFSILEDIAESILTGTPIIPGILIGLPEAFITAIIAGNLGLLDSIFVGLAVKELYLSYVEQEQQADQDDEHAWDHWISHRIVPADRTYQAGELTVHSRVGLALSLGALGFARIPTYVYEALKGAISQYLEVPEEVAL